MKPFALIAVLLMVGCASAPLDHDSIAPEVAPIFELAKQDAIRNYRNQWHAEQIVPFMGIVAGKAATNGWIEKVDETPANIWGIRWEIVP